MPTYRTAVRTSWSGASGSPGYNTWHARQSVTPNPPFDSLQDLSNALKTFYTAALNHQPGGTAIDHDGIWTTVDGSADVVQTTPWHLEKGGAAAFAPPANCLLVEWGTASPTRRGKGRTFISPLTNTAIGDDGRPDPGVITDMLAAAATLIASSEDDDGGALGVYSRSSNLFRDFQTRRIPNLVAVLRSRRD